MSGLSGFRSTKNVKAMRIYVVLMLVLSTSIYATSSFSLVNQDARTITGTVTDENGAPLPGVNVALKGMVYAGTITDGNGKYSIEVSDENAVLAFSFVGYVTQEVAVLNKQVINVQLVPTIEQLDQVVVIGYGTKRKATVTGAIATTSGAELQKAATTNIVKALTGQMTGVIVNTRSSAPGAETMDINIRGKGSWRSGSPLIIIDGIANRDGFERLDPNDIESISVLKDASAAIYGSRAANGVILVNTKRGSMGKPTIEYTGDFGITQPVRVPEMARSFQYAQYYTEAKRNGYIFTDQEIENYRLGSNPNLFPNYDLSDYIIQNAAPETKHSLALSGGNEAVKYYVSGNYRFQDSFFKDGIDNFNSFGILSNIDAKVSDNFSLAFNLSGRRDDLNRAVGSGFTQAGGNIDVGWFESYFNDPTKPIFYENGLPAAIYENNTVERIKGAGGHRNQGNYTLNSQMTARWDLPFILDGLFLEGTGAYDFLNTRTKEFSKSYDVYAYDNSTGDYVNLNVNPVMSRGLYDYYFNSHKYTLNGKLGYNTSFGDHTINTFVAYEQYSFDTEWLSATRSSFLSANIPFMFAGDPNTQVNDGSGSEFAYRNVFGRFAYNYKEKYMLDFTMRRDESLKFPQDNRVGWFPGVSAGWRISEESFIKDNISGIDNLKLRASWGQMGSDNVMAYQYLATASLQDTWGSMVFGTNPAVISTLYFSGTPNPFIQWEVANTSNLGLEGSFLNSLVGFELELFRSNRSNILSPRNASVPYYAGMTLPDENIGEATNQGIEIMVWHRKRIGDISYKLSGNFTYLKNEIVFMDESPNVPDYQKREGHPIDSWLLYQTDGIFNTQEEFDATEAKRGGAQLGDIKYVDVNEDGAIDNLDMVRVYDSPMPRTLFGLNIDLQYKNFSLSMMWQGQAGAKTYINPAMRNGDINVPLWMYEGRWTPDNPDAELPRAFYHRTETYNTLESDFWLFDASFLRLRNLELSYNVPKPLLDNIFIERARIYVSGFNLLLFDKIKNYDPEVVNNLGVYYPATRVFNLGVKLSF